MPEWKKDTENEERKMKQKPKQTNTYHHTSFMFVLKTVKQKLVDFFFSDLMMIRFQMSWVCLN